MIYKDFENIDIAATLGVSPVGEDTKHITKYAMSLCPSRALDLGTGTGFISVFLSRGGVSCDATDINPMALECAGKNAKNNNVKVNLYYSDIFSGITGKYDLIIFNPPYGNSSSGLLTRPLEIIKSLLPKENPIIASAAFLLIKGGRRKMIAKFLEDSRRFLNPAGSIILVLHQTELPLVSGMSYKIFGEFKYLRFIHITT